MFEVTPLTTVNGNAEPLDEYRQRDLTGMIRSKLGWYMSTVPSSEAIISEFAPFEWVTKEGKLVKRLSKWIKQEFDIKLPSCALSDLGFLMASFFPGEFIYDITDRFDWKAGDFGDSGSCFWGSNTGARWAIQDAGGRAIRFWHDEGIGYGRAWVVPKNGDWFVFNAYGPDLEVVHERLEVIYPQAKIRKVNLENWGDVYGLVYINRSGLGLQVTERTIDTGPSARITIDLEVGDDEYENICEDCGRRMEDDDTYYVDDNTICRWCYEDNYYTCECCGDTVHRDDAYWRQAVGTRRGHTYTYDIALCDYCLYNQYSECDACDNVAYCQDDMMTEVEGGNYVCPICLENDYEQCPTCDTYILKGECHCEQELETA